MPVNTDFSSEVEPDSMIAEAIDDSQQAKLKAFGPTLAVPAHPSESCR